MADVDIDAFGEHGKTDETFPLTPGGGMDVVTHAQVHEASGKQETSFGGEGQRTKLVKEHVIGLYLKLSESMGKTSKAFHLDYFELRDGELYYKGKSTPGKLYYKGKSTPLTIKGGELRSVGEIKKILGKERLRNLGFDVLRGKFTARKATMLNKVEVELPSTSDIIKADNIELQEITENAAKNMEDLILQMKNDQSQTDDLVEYPLRELLGLDKELRSIRGLLKVEIAKKVQLEQHKKWEKCKLTEIENPLEYGDDQCQEIRNRIERLSEDLSQTDDLVEYHLRELLGLDKELRSIRGLLKVEIAKNVQLEQHIE